jgi:hypothetical protein
MEFDFPNPGWLAIDERPGHFAVQGLEVARASDSELLERARQGDAAAFGGENIAYDIDRLFRGVVRLVTARTGLAQPEAERRVDDVIARARENIGRARKSAVILAFSSGAAALLGLAVAWFAAGEGGKHRDGTPPSLVWGRRRPLTRGQGKSA